MTTLGAILRGVAAVVGFVPSVTRSVAARRSGKLQDPLHESNAARAIRLEDERREAERIRHEEEG